MLRVAVKHVSFDILGTDMPLVTFGAVMMSRPHSWMFSDLPPCTGLGKGEDTVFYHGITKGDLLGSHLPILSLLLRQMLAILMPTQSSLGDEVLGVRGLATTGSFPTIRPLTGASHVELASALDQCTRIRARQCIITSRHAPDALSRDLQRVNLAKYLSALPVVFFAMCHARVNSVFSFLWDLVMDWGLLHLTPGKPAHFGLRPVLLFPGPALLYYFAVFLNFIGRTLWSLRWSEQATVFLGAFFLSSVQQSAEVIRRCLWNVFRVEWQCICKGKCPRSDKSFPSWAFASAGWHGEMSTRRVGLRDPKFFQWVADTAVQMAPQFTSQNCSNLVWSFATMRINHEALFDSMAAQVQGWLLSNFDPQHLSNVLWSYAKLAVKNYSLFQSAADEIVKRGVDYLARTPQNLSNSVWAYGVISSRPPQLMSVQVEAGFIAIVEGVKQAPPDPRILCSLVPGWHHVEHTDSCEEDAVSPFPTPGEQMSSRWWMRTATASNKSIRTAIFAAPRRRESQKWQQLFNEPSILFRPVKRRRARDGGEANDNAIVAEIRRLACTVNCVALMIEVRAALHEDGNGSVTLADAFEARDTRQEAEFILNFLQNLGYYDGTGFLQQFVLNFWFTNALGALTVYPQQVPILALYDLLLNNANRSWQRHREDRAFFLPKSSTQVLTRTGKKQFGNGLAKAIFRDGGPLVRRDSKELVTQALAKMGYIDSGLNRDFQEAILVFVNVNTNKTSLRKMALQQRYGPPGGRQAQSSISMKAHFRPFANTPFERHGLPSENGLLADAKCPDAAWRKRWQRTCEISALEHHLTAAAGFYDRLTEVRPLGKSSRAQLAMTVLSLHRLGLTPVAWHVFDRLAQDGLQAGGEAYSNWLFIAGETRDPQREVDVFEQMARTAHTRGLQGACWNSVAIRCCALGDERRARIALQQIDAEQLCNPMSAADCDLALRNPWDLATLQLRFQHSLFEVDERAGLRMDVFDASSRRVKLLKSTSCQDSPPHIMVMPVGTFVIVQTPQAGTAEYGARAAATQCQDVRLHYLCSGVYLIPVASSADGKMSPESFELVRLITTSTQWKHMPNCRSGPDAQWDRHLRRRRYGLASCR
eukprot:s302_g1.t2